MHSRNWIIILFLWSWEECLRLPGLFTIMFLYWTVSPIQQIYTLKLDKQKTKNRPLKSHWFLFVNLGGPRDHKNGLISGWVNSEAYRMSEDVPVIALLDKMIPISSEKLETWMSPVVNLKQSHWWEKDEFSNTFFQSMWHLIWKVIYWEHAPVLIYCK